MLLSLRYFFLFIFKKSTLIQIDSFFNRTLEALLFKSIAFLIGHWTLDRYTKEAAEIVELIHLKIVGRNRLF